MDGRKDARMEQSSGELIITCPIPNLLQVLKAHISTLTCCRFLVCTVYQSPLLLTETLLKKQTRVCPIWPSMLRVIM